MIQADVLIIGGSAYPLIKAAEVVARKMQAK